MFFRVRFYKIFMIYKMPETVDNTIMYIIDSMRSNRLLNG